MKRTRGNRLFILLTPIMAAVLMTAIGSTVMAYDVSYTSRRWDESTKSVVDEILTADNCSVIKESTFSGGGMSGYYYMPGNTTVTVEKRVTVHGTACIILGSNSNLIMKDGLEVSGEGTGLEVFGKSDDTGKLTCYADTNDNAAIGSNGGQKCGYIKIYGGTVIADAYNGGQGDNGAGIGGGNQSDGGIIEIYGGSVTARGANISYDGGAGIGGGECGNGGTINIYGGTVTANGGNDGAGIGGGDKGNGGDISIYGGTVKAVGGSNGAGIGGGDADGNGKSGGNIQIYGGTVTAYGGDDSAGIGGGEGCGAGTIEIYGGKVNAAGGSKYADGGAGIGSGGKDGRNIEDGVIRIHGGTVTAGGGADAAGIGGGDGMSGGTIEITGGTVNATGGTGETSGKADVGGAGIGGGQNGSGGTINISGGEVIAKAVFFAAGIGGGHGGTCGNITISGGDVKAEGGSSGGTGIGTGCGPGESAKNETIRITGGRIDAKGYKNAAGIGGHEKYGPGTIEISNASVTAEGGNNGAGIGSGYRSNSVHIIIENSEIDATGGMNGAGIGGGELTRSDLIEISNSTVNAVGGRYAAGIGGGSDADGGTVRITDSDIKAMGKGGSEGKGRAIGAGVATKGSSEKNNGTVEFFGDAVIIRAGHHSGDMVLLKEDEYKANHTQSYVEIKFDYALIYDANGATGGTVPEVEIHERGSKVTVTGNSGALEKPQHTFAGWNTKADGSGVTYQAGDSFTFTGRTTLYARWDCVPASYLDWDGSGLVEKTCNIFENVTADTADLADGRWYAVYGEVNNSNRITVNGTAHLILSDGAVLNAQDGITVKENNSLIIHGQSGMTGTITAISWDSAGIGSNDYEGCGTVIINGCNVTAKGGGNAAGIGGDQCASGGNITVNGGIVTAIGDTYAAGIGGGGGDMYVEGGSGGTVTVNGGTVRATGTYAAGIGAGYGSIDDGSLIVAGGHIAYSSEITIPEEGDKSSVYHVSGEGKEITITRKPYMLIEKETFALNYNFTYSVPAVVIANNSIYSGTEKPLVTVIGEAIGGTMYYAVGENSTAAPADDLYSTSIPNGTEVGTYCVWYKVAGDDSHFDTEPGCITAVVYDKNTLICNGEDQELVKAGTVEGGKMVYVSGTDDVTAPDETAEWSEKIPTGKEVGEYFVWYKVFGDDNHMDTEPECIKVAIVPDSQVDAFEELLKTLPGNKAGEGKGLVDAAAKIKEQMTPSQLALVPQETLDLFEEGQTAFAKGRIFRSGSAYYRVLSNGDVTYLRPASNDMESSLVPNQVKKGRFFFKVIRVSNNAFRNCKQLNSVIISENVYVFGENVFAGTDNLAEVRIKGTGFRSGKVTNAFRRAGHIKLTVPGSKAADYDSLFRSEGRLSDRSVVAAA